MNKKPAAPGTGATSYDKQSNKSSKPKKHELCIHQLLKAGTRGINQLRALSTYHDTCLNTTISELGRYRGLLILREKRPHINSAGGNSPFCWYWFPDREEAEKALTLLNELRIKRCASTLSFIEAETILVQFPEPNEPAS